MASCSGLPYLQRQRILASRFLHTAKYYPGASPVHRRPIVYNPEAFTPDTPGTRVLTQTEQLRLPYRRAVGTDQGCEGCIGT